MIYRGLRVEYTSLEQKREAWSCWRPEVSFSLPLSHSCRDPPPNCKHLRQNVDVKTEYNVEK